MRKQSGATDSGHLIKGESIFVPASAMKEAGENCYAVKVDGNCLAPEIPSDATLICDPDQVPTPGDYIAIWWKDETRCPMLKRLTRALPRDLAGASCDFELLLECEQLNPPRRYCIPTSTIKSVNKVIHVV